MRLDDFSSRADLIDALVIRVFHKQFSRARRRGMSADQVAMVGSRITCNLWRDAALRVFQPKVPRAYLIGLRRGYRAGITAHEGETDG